MILPAKGSEAKAWSLFILKGVLNLKRDLKL